MPAFKEDGRMLYFKRAACSLLFLLGLLALLAAASAVFQPKDNTHEAGMEEVSANGILAEPENTIDVLVVGDSESYAAVSPMQIWKEAGYTAYVCGTSSQELSYSYTMLDRAFQRQKPKIVILETLAVYRQMELRDVGLDEISRRLPIFRYHDRWKSIRANDFGGIPQSSWTSFNKGHWTTKNIDPCGNDPYMTPTDSTPQIAPLNKWYVRAIKKLCEENGAQLLFLSTPSPINWNYERHNGIQALAQELDCEYIDLNLLNEQIKIDWSQDTHDKGDHLNHFGAVKVTQFLTEYLQEKAVLEDHRSDPAFAKWHEELKQHEA